MAILGTGGIDNNLWCEFFHKDLQPNSIRLPLGVGSVSWEYTLNTSVQDTYGGQVVQILGVSITNLIITGNFGGFDPQWGIDVRKDPRHGDFDWVSTGRYANGLQQMADWFRQYFELTTQGGENKRGSFQRYNEVAMKFNFPGRGWSFYLRPTSFPSIKMANDNISPEWRVQADFVEEAESDRSFLKDIEKSALERLDDLRVGIGFMKRNPFSEFVNETITNFDAANQVIEAYQDSVVNGYSDDEIDELVEYGYSFPGSAYKRSGFSVADFI